MLSLLSLYRTRVDHVVMMTLESGSCFSFSLHMFELFLLGSLGSFLLPLVSMYSLQKYSSLSFFFLITFGNEIFLFPFLYFKFG